MRGGEAREVAGDAAGAGCSGCRRGAEERSGGLAQSGHLAHAVTLANFFFRACLVAKGLIQSGESFESARVTGFTERVRAPRWDAMRVERRDRTCDPALRPLVWLSWGASALILARDFPLSRPDFSSTIFVGGDNLSLAARHRTRGGRHGPARGGDRAQAQGQGG